jgi:hypothetical protein
MKDKKKFLVLGVLALLIVGVGAFQFTKGSPPPPAPAPVKKDDKADDAAKPAPDANLEANAFKGQVLPQRDPFKSALASAPTTPPVVTPTTTQMPPTLKGGTHLPTAHDNGALPPMPGGFGTTGGPTGTQVKPVDPGPPPFEYHLGGIILGTKPCAVFIDGAGNQRLVSLGGSLDGDTHVESISRGRVTVRHGSETTTLTLGGNPSGK